MSQQTKIQQKKKEKKPRRSRTWWRKPVQPRRKQCAKSNPARPNSQLEANLQQYSKLDLGQYGRMQTTEPLVAQTWIDGAKMADDLSRSFGKSRRKKIRIIILKKLQTIHNCPILVVNFLSKSKLEIFKNYSKPKNRFCRLKFKREFSNFFTNNLSKLQTAAKIFIQNFWLKIGHKNFSFIKN